MTTLESQIEAILFVAGEGLSIEFLAEKLGVTKAEAGEVIESLKKRYSGECGIHLIKYRNCYQFSTNPAIVESVNLVLNPVREKNLTRAAMETMAIVAYKQPVTRLEIEEVRGVASDYAINILLENNLIEVKGRKDALGKPLLYGTTDEFLKRFELENIDGMPSYEQLMEKIKVIQTNFDLYESNRQ